MQLDCTQLVARPSAPEVVENTVLRLEFIVLTIGSEENDPMVRRHTQCVGAVPTLFGPWKWLVLKSNFPSWSRGFESRLPLHIFNSLPRLAPLVEPTFRGNEVSDPLEPINRKQL